MNAAILIVDDSLTVRMDLQDALAGTGRPTILCKDLASARSALAKESIALVVLDIILPDGDGIDLLKEIRSNAATAGLPVLLLSSENDVRDRVRGLVVGANDYLGKPYDRLHVADRVSELLRKGRTPDGAVTRPLVLVIDDSPTYRNALQAALEANGYSVQTAESGEEGLQLAGRLLPAALIVDGQLPGIDGPTVLRRLRDHPALRHTPCVLLTASAESTHELHALEAGADLYVTKQEGIEVVLTRLDSLLRSAIAPTAIDRQVLRDRPTRILAVDDSLSFLHAVTAELRNDSYEVLQAKSGEEALAVLADEKVDCILLDLVMPGLSGEETCRRIKSAGPHRDVPVMILTANKDQEALLSCLRAGADDYVPKEVEFDVLRGRVRAQLRRKQYEGENRLVQEVISTLRKSEALLGGLFESAPDAIVVTDRDGRIVRINAQAEALFGYARAEILNRPVELLVPDRFRTAHVALRQKFIEESRLRPMTPDRDLWGRRKDGSEFPADILLGPVSTEDGLLVLATVRDVTRRKEMEQELLRKSDEVREVSQQLWQAAKLATMGELAASIAHELNNPLATLMLGIEDLLLQAVDPALKKELTIMEQEAERMKRLIANLLQSSRTGQQQISTFDVADEIDKTIELSHHFLRKRGVVLTREFVRDLPMVQADRQQLRQVFLNLIVNACDAMPDGGSLTVTTEFSRVDQKSAVTIAFSDTGTGIPRELLPRIMEPFFTTKPPGKGTGLGLAICRRIVQEHHGVFECFSEAGRGTTMRLTLPVSNGSNGKHLDAH